MAQYYEIEQDYKCSSLLGGTLARWQGHAQAIRLGLRKHSEEPYGSRGYHQQSLDL